MWALTEPARCLVSYGRARGSHPSSHTKMAKMEECHMGPGPQAALISLPPSSLQNEASATLPGGPVPAVPP